MQAKPLSAELIGTAAQLCTAMYKAVKPTSNLRPARQRTALGNGILEHARPLFVRRGSAAEPKTVRTTETKLKQNRARRFFSSGGRNHCQEAYSLHSPTEGWPG